MPYFHSMSLLLCLPWLSFASDVVDTVQFGRIKYGMAEAEVSRRLGEPRNIYEEPSAAATAGKPPEKATRSKRRYSYFYPGNAQIMDALITFEDGKVVEKVQIAR